MIIAVVATTGVCRPAAYAGPPPEAARLAQSGPAQQAAGPRLPFGVGTYLSDKALSVPSLMSARHGYPIEVGFEDPFTELDPAWQADSWVTPTVSDGQLHLAVNADAPQIYGALSRWVELDVDEYPTVEIAVSGSPGLWALKVNDGTLPVDVELQGDTGDTGVHSYDLKQSTGWHGVKRFRLSIFTIGLDTSLTVDGIRVDSRAIGFADSFSDLDPAWQASSGVTPTVSDGQLQLTMNPDAPLSYGALSRSVELDVDKYPTVQITVSGSTGLWALKVNDGSLPVDIELQSDVSKTGTYSYDLTKFTGWQGIKEFQLRIFAIGLGQPVSIDRIQIGRQLPFVPGCEANAPSDFNGDGVRDVVIADPEASVDGLSGAGVVHVVDGATGAVRDIHQNLAEIPWDADAGDNFGHAIAVFDANSDGCADLAVGVPNEDVNGVPDSGQVDLIFGAPGGLGSGPQTDTYLQGSGGLPDSPEPTDRFGYSLAAGVTDTEEPYLIVGAPGDNVVDGSDHSGSIMYLRSGVKERFSQPSIGLTAEPDDRTGFAVAASSRHFAFSAPGENVNGRGQFAGMICGFRHNSGPAAPRSIGCVHQDGLAQAGDEFGKSLAMVSYWPSTDSLLAVGSPGQDVDGVVDAGQVVQLRVTDTAITEPIRISQSTTGIAGDATPGDRFGEKVLLVNTAATAAPSAQTLLLAVGATGEDASGTGIDTGNVHVFAAGTATPESDTLIERTAGKLPGSPAARELLGLSMGASPSELFVASPYVNQGVWAIRWSDLAAGTAAPARSWAPSAGNTPAAAFGAQVG
ncbi:integrin alpha [Catellatospora sp. NPDC049111]|uniref:integrin alpha n=1 Tax=Catellatospora sp. NPDC049111 TaxID=3155271 RepID=UPI0033EBBC5E